MQSSNKETSLKKNTKSLYEIDKYYITTCEKKAKERKKKRQTEKKKWSKNHTMLKSKLENIKSNLTNSKIKQSPEIQQKTQRLPLQKTIGTNKPEWNSSTVIGEVKQNKDSSNCKTKRLLIQKTISTKNQTPAERLSANKKAHIKTQNRLNNKRKQKLQTPHTSRNNLNESTEEIMKRFDNEVKKPIQSLNEWCKNTLPEITKTFQTKNV